MLFVGGLENRNEGEIEGMCGTQGSVGEERN
jgi:hypothetical protein